MKKEVLDYACQLILEIKSIYKISKSKKEDCVRKSGIKRKTKKLALFRFATPVLFLSHSLSCWFP